jgi:Ala-tRNA(Pro) deacylase
LNIGSSRGLSRRPDRAREPDRGNLQPSTRKRIAIRRLRQATGQKEIVMPINRLKQFLDEHNIKYVVISHSVAYTAQGIAALAHIPGKELAKTVIVKIDDKFAMAVVTASRQVDLHLLKAAAHANNVELASEMEFKSEFPDCETGAMPPFGNLYDMPVFTDVTLAQDEEIAFNAGSHRELVRLAWADFEKLVHPVVVPLALLGARQPAA